MFNARIDREALVRRHNIVIRSADVRLPLTVGNGEFAFTADFTGLQTFPHLYTSHIPLCTMSQWGWHSFPMPPAIRSQRLRPTELDTFGRRIGYFIDPTGQEALFNHLRQNPHRLHLGRIGLRLLRSDGSQATLEDVSEICQQLDLWTGLLVSRFRFDGHPVEVHTCCAGEQNAIAVRVTSPLIYEGRIRVVLAFPYGSPDVHAADWDRPTSHRTNILKHTPHRVDFTRALDADQYHAALAWSTPAKLNQPEAHTYELASESGDRLECVFACAPHVINDVLPDVETAERASAAFWHDYWTSGGAIDLSGSTDPRAAELERRIVTSQYLMRVNCAGSLPPAETGLTCNSWFGKFHLEMHWWHGVHFAAWGRLSLLEKSLDYYHRIFPEACNLAARQGYRGARWPKMVARDGVDSPSNVGQLLLWQQPHPIYYAELIYAQRPTPDTLAHWAEIVDATAEFMASFAHFDPERRQYVLGPPMKTVSENNDPTNTFNPAFELTYWRWGLSIAQAWRERAGVARHANWDEILSALAPLAVEDGTYLMQENMRDTFDGMNWEHPALIGICGVLPGTEVDAEIHRRTVERVMKVWQWDRCWGWDFPMTAMASARAGRPELAVDALFIDSKKNTYSAVGHNYQRPGLALYLPGNGGLLAAVAMMAAGWEGAPDGNAPGFPEGFVVRHEGLQRLF